jgi:hypothetical protein
VFALSDCAGQNAQTVSSLSEQLIVDAENIHRALAAVYTSVEKVIQESEDKHDDIGTASVYS